MLTKPPSESDAPHLEVGVGKQAAAKQPRGSSPLDLTAPLGQFSGSMNVGIWVQRNSVACFHKQCTS